MERHAALSIFFSTYGTEEQLIAKAREIAKRIDLQVGDISLVKLNGNLLDNWNAENYNAV